MNLAQLRAMLRSGRIPLIRGGMPIPLAAVSVTVTAAVTITSTTETILATLPAISPPFASPTIRLVGITQINAGANATSLTMRFRRGTLVTGTLVGVAAAEGGGVGFSAFMAHAAEDTPGEVAGQQYVFTVTQNVGPGNGAANFVECLAFAF